MIAKLKRLLIIACWLVIALLISAASTKKPEKIKAGPIKSDTTGGILSFIVPLEVHTGFAAGALRTIAAAQTDYNNVPFFDVETILQASDIDGNLLCASDPYITPIDETTRTTSTGNDYVLLETLSIPCVPWQSEGRTTVHVKVATTLFNPDRQIIEATEVCSVFDIDVSTDGVAHMSSDLSEISCAGNIIQLQNMLFFVAAALALTILFVTQDTAEDTLQLVQDPPRDSKPDNDIPSGSS